MNLNQVKDYQKLQLWYETFTNSTSLQQSIQHELIAGKTLQIGNFSTSKFINTIVYDHIKNKTAFVSSSTNLPFATNSIANVILFHQLEFVDIDMYVAEINRIMASDHRLIIVYLENKLGFLQYFNKERPIYKKLNISSSAFIRLLLASYYVIEVKTIDLAANTKAWTSYFDAKIKIATLKKFKLQQSNFLLNAFTKEPALYFTK